MSRLSNTAPSNASAKRVTINYERPLLYPLQEQAIFYPRDASGALARFSFIEASTKSGKTHGCIAWLVEQAIQGRRGQNYWWIAPVYQQAQIAFNRMRDFYPSGTFIVNESALKLTFATVGSVIMFKSAEKPDNLYGEDVYAAVYDEASRGREESWHALRSTLTATRGPVRFIGNVKGRKNWFYALARKAEHGEPGSAYFKITAADAVAAGVLDGEEIESARRDLPEQVFRELYLVEPSDDGGNPFGLAAIAKCVGPISQKPAVVWGWDLAKHVDWTVGIALDADGAICRVERFQQPWESTFTRIIASTGKVPALVDSTGVGDPIVERLQRSGSNFEGFNFSQPSKQRLMEGLAVAIQAGEVTVLNGVIRSELEDFEYEYTRTGVRYCVSPDTPVLTNDLRWVTASTLSAGDGIAAFDEDPIDGNAVRRWRNSSVISTSIIQQPCYRLTMEDGSSVVCSAEHKWLIANTNGPAYWRKTSDLRGRHSWSTSKRFSPHQLIRVSDVWESAKTYSAGYLAGAFDGEGSLSQLDRKGRAGVVVRLSLAQRDNEMAAQLRLMLAEHGFQWSEAGRGGTNGDVITFDIVGGMKNKLRLLGELRPARLLAKLDIDRLGAFWAEERVAIRSIEFLGERDVVAMETSTKTFIANGFASHNCAPEGFHDDCVMALGLAVDHKSRANSPMVVTTEFAHALAGLTRRRR